MTEELLKVLHESGFFESDEEGVQRELVLGKLNSLIREFVREVGRRKGLPESLTSEVTGKIYTFGSYRLGVHSKGADIDTLCVAPQHVTRLDFFTIFYQILENNSEVTDLTQVPDAYVPVIRMKFSGISIDLLFARLNLNSIPEDLDLLDSNLLRNLDEKCILSLNGPRVTDEILTLVPNVETFHVALRCIKLWAKRRGVYNNAMGYVAGVALALLTARICQLYPNSAPSTVVTRLFRIYQQWDWSQPVYLKPIEDLPLGMKVWNPRVHVADRYHKMPVITPAYPSMCSTHNVTKSTLLLMTDEFKRGAEIMIKIEQNKALWSDLFAKTDFFTRHRNFFQVLAVSETEERHLIWSGFLGSKLRHLIPKLELEPYIVAAPPYHDGFEQIIEASSIEDIRQAHFHIDEQPNETKNTATPLTDTPRKKYYTMAFYVALVISPPDPNQKGPRRLCLDTPVNDFKNFLMGYEKLTPDMQILIRDIKRENLPDYVFEGAPRPPRPRKLAKVIPKAPGTPTEHHGSPKRTRTVIGNDRGEISLDSSMSLSNSNLSTAVQSTNLDESTKMNPISN